jgi:rhomboid protease GluP
MGLEFAVHFTEPGFAGALGSVPAAPWKLAGAGTIALEGDKFILAGRKRFLFVFKSRARDEITLDRIRNVRQAGASISFDVTFTGGDAKRLRAWAADEAEARAIAAALPTVTTEAFVRLSDDANTFESALQAVQARSIVTPVLVAINVLVFAGTTLGGGGFVQPDGVAMLRFGTNYGPLTADGQWWRLFTATFLHFGVVHLLLNMWALASLGNLTERLFGSARYLALYVFAGLCGSLASYYWHPGVNSAGASGAIFGVIGALLAFMFNPKTHIPPSVAAAQRNSAMVFIAYNLVNGFAHSGIDNAAHIGGLVGGFAIGWLLARPITVEARQDSGRSFAIIGTGAIAALLVAAWPLVLPSPGQRSDSAFRRSLEQFADIKSRAVDLQNKLAGELKQHAITEFSWAQSASTEVVPLWREAQAVVLARPVADSSRYAPLRKALLNYVDLRIRLFSYSVNAIQHTLPADQQAAYEALPAQVEAALKQVKALAGATE